MSIEKAVIDSWPLLGYKFRRDDLVLTVRELLGYPVSEGSVLRKLRRLKSLGTLGYVIPRGYNRGGYYEKYEI